MTSRSNQGFRFSQRVLRGEGVGEGEVAGEAFGLGADGFRQGGLPVLAEVPGLGVLADEEGEAEVRQVFEKAGVPEGGAFRAGWEVAALPFSRVAEAHGDDGDAGFVVEFVAGELEPVAEAVAGGVVPGDAGPVDAGAGGLSDEEDAGGDGDPEDGTGAEGGRCFSQTRQARTSARRSARRVAAERLLTGSSA